MNDLAIVLILSLKLHAEMFHETIDQTNGLKDSE